MVSMKSMVALGRRFDPCFALFALVFVIHFGYVLYYQKEWLLGGEMWAEMATNYFPNSLDESWQKRLFSLDSGYVPFPQRIMSLIFAFLGLSAQQIPHAYNWASMFASTGLVAVFCLRPFRQVIEGDLLRFLVCCCVLLAVDFESRTYINFTYFVAFYAAVISLLCWVRRADQPVPWYAYALPFWMFSKPAVLAALPVVMAAGFFARSKFRLIAFASVAVCAVQVWILKSSQAGSGFAPKVSVSGPDAVLATLGYGVGFLAKYVCKIDLVSSPALIVGGLALFSSLVLFFVRKERVERLLMFAGLSLIFGNMAINCFAISNDWNIDMTRLEVGHVYRHLNVAYFGAVLFVAGVIGVVCGSAGGRWSPVVPRIVMFLLFCAWVSQTEQLKRAKANLLMPPFPIVYASQWQQMAKVIDSRSPACVPVNPFGWVYKRGCMPLGEKIDSMSAIIFGEGKHFNVSPSHASLGASSGLLAMAAVAKVEGPVPEVVQLDIKVHLVSGESLNESVSRLIHPSGGLMHVQFARPLVVRDVQDIDVTVSGNASLGQLQRAPARLAVTWYGVQ